MVDESWWTDVERWVIAPGGEPPGDAVQRGAARVLQADLDFDLDAAHAALAAIRSEADPDVAAFLELQLRLRRVRGKAFDELARDAVALAGRSEDAVAARALHVAGLARLQLLQLDQAAADVIDGLACDPWAGRRTWMMDTLAGVLLSAGGWIEARLSLDYVAKLRTELGDPIGIAITAGRRANLELDLGNPQAAAEIAGAAVETVGDRLPAGSRLRLNTLRLMAALDTGASPPDLVAAVRADIDQAHVSYLRGHAALTLMRTEGADRSGWLEIARAGLSSPVGAALVDAWVEHLVHGALPPVPPAERGPANEATFERCLLRAERAWEGRETALAAAWLDRATELATAANRPLWMTRVDDRYSAIDPVRHALQAARRYSGLPLEALARTVQEEVTIVFNDLVGFTSRSTKIGPQATMDTVRSLFEITAPVLASHQVRPLQYLGDGLLAVAQGPAHAERGLEFAQRLVRRTGTATRIRRARGEEFGLVTRAGVASGPVVLGLLGSFVKMEHLAIGETTNLAARLQGVAAPGQVITPGTPQTETERVTLKGIDGPFPIQRIVVHASTEPWKSASQL